MPYLVAARDDDNDLTGILVNTRPDSKKDTETGFNAESEFQYEKTLRAAQDQSTFHDYDFYNNNNSKKKPKADYRQGKTVLQLANEYGDTLNPKLSFTTGEAVANHIRGLKGKDASEFTRYSGLQDASPKGWHEELNSVKIDVMKKVQIDRIKANTDGQAKKLVETIIAFKRLGIDIGESSRTDGGWGFKENVDINQVGTKGGEGENNLGKILTAMAIDFDRQLQGKDGKIHGVDIAENDIQAKMKEIESAISSGKLNILTYLNIGYNKISATPATSKYCKEKNIAPPPVQNNVSNQPPQANRNNTRTIYTTKGDSIEHVLGLREFKNKVTEIGFGKSNSGQSVIKFKFSNSKDASDFRLKHLFGKSGGANGEILIMNLNQAQTMFENMKRGKFGKTKPHNMIAALKFHYDKEVKTQPLNNNQAKAPVVNNIKYNNPIIQPQINRSPAPQNQQSTTTHKAQSPIKNQVLSSTSDKNNQSPYGLINFANNVKSILKPGDSRTITATDGNQLIYRLNADQSVVISGKGRNQDGMDNKKEITIDANGNITPPKDIRWGNWALKSLNPDIAQQTQLSSSKQPISAQFPALDHVLSSTGAKNLNIDDQTFTLKFANQKDAANCIGQRPLKSELSSSGTFDVKMDMNTAQALFNSLGIGQFAKQNSNVKINTIDAVKEDYKQYVKNHVVVSTPKNQQQTNSNAQQNPAQKIQNNSSTQQQTNSNAQQNPKNQQNTKSIQAGNKKAMTKGATIGVAVGAAAIFAIGVAFPPIGGIIITTIVAASILVGCAMAGAAIGRAINKKMNGDKVNKSQTPNNRVRQEVKEREREREKPKSKEFEPLGKLVPPPHITPSSKTEEQTRNV